MLILNPISMLGQPPAQVRTDSNSVEAAARVELISAIPQDKRAVYSGQRRRAFAEGPPVLGASQSHPGNTALHNCVRDSLARHSAVPRGFASAAQFRRCQR